jgi:hypothetical protein
MRKSFLIFILILIGLSLNAQKPSLIWDRNSDHTIGYRVYSGPNSRDYNLVSDVGDTNYWTYPSNVINTIVFFSVTAYDTNNLESDFSEEVYYNTITNINNDFPSVPTGLEIVNVVIGVPEVILDITNGLITWLKFNEAGGLIASDSTTNNLFGTLVNGPIFQDGSVSLDGTDDFINLGNITQLNSLTNFSVSIWYKLFLIPSGATVLCAKWDNSFGGVFNVIHSPISEAIVFYIHNASGLDYVSYHWGLGDLDWHHVVGVYNGEDMRIYFDGLPTPNVKPKTGPLPASDWHDVKIGSSQNADFFRGSFDDFRIYNRALSSNDVFSIYNSR